jgi:hypothetical protein
LSAILEILFVGISVALEFKYIYFTSPLPALHPILELNKRLTVNFIMVF